MRQNLLETYAKQLKVAEAYVAKNFDGRTVSSNAKLTTAVLLDNTNRWMTEALNTTATERSDLGNWKKFCLNLTNIAVPSLIANDLVIVHPMTSYSGSVAYLKYVSKTDKGGIEKGFEFNSVFGLGESSEARTAFTSQVIVETVGSDGKLALTPIKNGRFGPDVEIGKGLDAKVIHEGQVTFVAVEDLAATIVPGDKVAYVELFNRFFVKTDFVGRWAVNCRPPQLFIFIRFISISERIVITKMLIG